MIPIPFSSAIEALHMTKINANNYDIGLIDAYMYMFHKILLIYQKCNIGDQDIFSFRFKTFNRTNDIEVKNVGLTGWKFPLFGLTLIFLISLSLIFYYWSKIFTASSASSAPPSVIVPAAGKFVEFLQNSGW